MSSLSYNSNQLNSIFTAKVIGFPATELTRDPRRSVHYSLSPPVPYPLTLITDVLITSSQPSIFTCLKPDTLLSPLDEKVNACKNALFHVGFTTRSELSITGLSAGS